jgi:hypothetical protein
MKIIYIIAIIVCNHQVFHFERGLFMDNQISKGAYLQC